MVSVAVIYVVLFQWVAGVEPDLSASSRKPNLHHVSLTRTPIRMTWYAASLSAMHPARSKQATDTAVPTDVPFV